jgi:16S rRNA processing protein RimM
MAASGTFGEERVCVGEVGAPRGLRGEFCVRSFTAEPRAVADYGALTTDRGGGPLRLCVVGEKKGALIVRADGVGTREQAEALRGCRLFAARTALPRPGDDEYYYADLIGLRAHFEADEGAIPGRVSAVHDYGGGPVLEIARDGRPSVLVPFSRVAVPHVDLTQGRLVISAIPGLLAPAEEASHDA